MAGCCESCAVSCAADLAGIHARMTVALVGNPNCGKTAIFNVLTGLRQRVANYPGVTVEKKIGLCRLPDGGVAQIIDLPGTYSLTPRSPDERVTIQVLRGLRADTPVPEVIIAVVDAVNLERNLYLVSHLLELGRPLVVALSMVDLALARGVAVDAERLGIRLGVPVVPVVGHRGHGVANLVRALAAAPVAASPEWPRPASLQREIGTLAEALAPFVPHPPDRRSLRRIAARVVSGDDSEDLREALSAEGVAVLVGTAGERLRTEGIDPMQAEIEARYSWIENVVAECRLAAGTLPAKPGSAAGPPPMLSTTRATASHVPWSDRLDSVLTHRLWGLITFAAIMGAMFVSMFWLARPLQEALSGVIGRLGALAASRLPGAALQSLVRDGVFAGVGSVLVFVPQIAILFLFLAVLEDTGYLARAAFLMDRLLAGVGLHGKSFIPLLSGFACAIPAIMATRTIEERKGRLATILVVPFMTCSARLPVYSLLVGTFFAGLGPWRLAGIMFLLYALGIAFAAGAAFALRRTLLRGRGSGFLLELPTYKLPQPAAVGRQVWTNSSKFLARAGTTIFLVCLVLWGVSYYPRLPATEAARYPQAGARDAAQQAYSLAGRLGHAVEPALRPLGFDWKMGVGMVGAFAAREVFVSTLAIVYGTGGDDKAGASLGAAMQADRHVDGGRVWTPLVAASLLLWFVLAMQCLSTVMVVRQETGGWRWALFMLGYMNALAYVSCLLFYQAGTRVLGG